jgi:hypothetical protein
LTSFQTNKAAIASPPTNSGASGMPKANVRLLCIETLPHQPCEQSKREGRQPLCTNASAYLQVDEKRD